MNQPLAAIVNNANACLGLLPQRAHDLDEVREALADIVRDAEPRERHHRARAQCWRCDRSPEKVPLRLRDVVDDVVALAAAESATRRVAIRTEVAADLPPCWETACSCSRCCLNLVVNGMDAMSTVAERRAFARDSRAPGQPGRQSRGAGSACRIAGSAWRPDRWRALFEAVLHDQAARHGDGTRRSAARSSRATGAGCGRNAIRDRARPSPSVFPPPLPPRRDGHESHRLRRRRRRVGPPVDRASGALPGLRRPDVRLREGVPRPRARAGSGLPRARRPPARPGRTGSAA